MFKKFVTAAHLLYLTFNFISHIDDKNGTNDVITCSDLKKIPFLGSAAISMSDINFNKSHVDYYLSTNLYKNDPLKIDPYHMTALKKSAFDPASKTFIIIHGYQSSGTKPWVLDLKDKLLDTRDANVIIVDWGEGSHSKNYVNAARYTQLISVQLFNFLQAVRVHVQKWSSSSKNIKWNHLHFIGHSLGAHISGQTAYHLKQDSFWKVERLTGLDPANPCFADVKPHLRIDKQNADFVDIIHTQVGAEDEVSAFGLKKSIGHVDFFVNGGVLQPQCMGSIITLKWNKVICSHKSAYVYFAESIVGSQNKTCQFDGHEWEGSFHEAEKIFNNTIQGVPCKKCPKMGINVNKKERGNFLVITSTKEPYCHFEETDKEKVKTSLRKIKDHLWG